MTKTNHVQAIEKKSPPPLDNESYQITGSPSRNYEGFGSGVEGGGQRRGRAEAPDLVRAGSERRREGGDARFGGGGGSQEGVSRCDVGAGGGGRWHQRREEEERGGGTGSGGGGRRGRRRWQGRRSGRAEALDLAGGVEGGAGPRGRGWR